VQALIYFFVGGEFKRRNLCAFKRRNFTANNFPSFLAKHFGVGAAVGALPKNSAALEKLWFTRLPDSSSSVFRPVLFGIG
jgi:hypothetical protein